jgi:hypothetical protein
MRTKKLIMSFPKIPRKRFIKLISKARGLKLSNREIYILFIFSDKFQKGLNAICGGFRNLASAVMTTKDAADKFILASGGYVPEENAVFIHGKESQ